ncbi:hypothetical protein A2767_06675 [Candidatus Roizmanbacteria bacterium RIFCSPHIGHO2_01_FULL_35_10]|uniref:Nudix hydrolase domain-containing protein n=1 Tax=Candidatus Roizmanbacteria bacterium RIFCSPLOWO2_01_FULL_35_13 TaxID=1802055 RepID=A0A1F7IAM6_9BACT|nr:MAG: hypothetical protein A2767_06675 [Candidatus Roizmanbacteria bacterium RIFCSPHIGHO2_01_FULL_35_10]OGK40390.1 MAG: hypothetical protein A3A74_01645 [Candidatus Roizmanbacteria bacterium RIFCSPLOWO2_01_FULL_35_13]
MKNVFEKEILTLKDRKKVNKKILQQFLKRIKVGKLTRNLNPADHFCTFIVPFDLKSKNIFIGHHINADQWIPPGGHIEEYEQPVNTVKREFEEELGVKITDKQIELFDLGITNVQGKQRSCKIHYDFWYLVFITKLNFKFDKKEFYKAQWLTIDESIKKVSHISIIKALNKLKNIHRL